MASNDNGNIIGFLTAKVAANILKEDKFIHMTRVHSSSRMEVA